MCKKIAGIVIYNPDIGRLEQNINSISPQVDMVVLQNNGIANINDLNQLIAHYDKVVVIGDGDNIGIAAALNRLAEYAVIQEAKWLLTLDQDSVCESELIRVYEKYVTEVNIGLITCTITDRNFQYNKEEADFQTRYIDNCITSGSYIRLSAWKEIGGFDEKMFIDHVDTDYCYRLRLSGWNIIQTSYKGLLHEVGSNTKRKHLLGKEFVVFNHSPFRCYYIVRNQIYFARKHRDTLVLRKSMRIQRTAWTRWMVYLLYEGNKREKMVAWAKGVRDGYRMSIQNNI